jgi:hypothetical protein
MTLGFQFASRSRVKATLSWESGSVHIPLWSTFL